MRIFTNMASLISQRALENNNARLGKSITRVASGIRIQSAADDGSGLSISEQLRADVSALQQGSRNLNDGISLVRTADGGMQEISDILIRLRELASQSATGTVGQNERDSIQLEFSALGREIDRIANVNEFNGQKLLDGSLAATASNQLVLQIGVNNLASNRMNLNQDMDLTAVTTSGLGLSGQSITTATNALNAMDATTTAVHTLTRIRGKVGAVLNRMAWAANSQNSAVENLTSAVSSIRDTDLAEEMATLTRNQILVQSASAMVGQSNLLPQSVLTLLG
jgi:flagellin